MAHAPVVIKKYANRRLYNTSDSRYVNLEEIAALVRNGTEVQVVDARTGKDLTRVTLTQIIMEDAKGQPAGLPLEMLRQMIRASNEAGQELMSWYLKSAFENYQKVQNALQSGLAQVGAAALTPIETVKKFVPGSSAPQGGGELEQLRRRIADLEARLQQPPRPRRRKPRR